VHDKAFDDLGSHDTLLTVQVGRRLVDQVHIGGLAQAQRSSNELLPLDFCT
jgi:hypothetical protein